MKAVRESCVLRSEVLKGDLGDAIFAADFGHVIEERAPGVYQNPEEFFRNTHPAAPLRKVISTIFGRLADPNEAGAVIRLSTGFANMAPHPFISQPVGLFVFSKDAVNLHFYISNVRIVRKDGSTLKYTFADKPHIEGLGEDIEIDFNIRS